MNIQEAIALIQQGVPQIAGAWADIGAGTGLFTQALQEILPNGTVYAVDKNPHALWRLDRGGAVTIEIREGDFTRAMDLPKVDGILMANALHYAQDPLEVLSNVLGHLNPGAPFILVEYDTDRPNPPWVPYPISQKRFMELAPEIGLSVPNEISRRPSNYGQGDIYVTVANKLA